jgi:hypothetical protein
LISLPDLIARVVGIVEDDAVAALARPHASDR